MVALLENAYHTMDENGRCVIKIERPVYQIEDVDTLARKNSSSDDNSLFDGQIQDSTCHFRKAVLSILPSITWLSNYNWKEDLLKDIIAGCTVAIMNIPQGMAYALLANVPPVVGIYMAFFPVLVYAFLGTSRHISMVGCMTSFLYSLKTAYINVVGSFAVVCLMTGKIVSEYSGSTSSADTIGNITSVADNYTPIQVATAISFMVGSFQVIMYACRLGIICSLLSETLVNGFIAGAAVHVFTSQIKDVFGFHVSSYTGLFQNVYTYIDIINHLYTINWIATAVSAFTITILLLNNGFVKPWVRARCIIPVPIELIVVLIGTFVSQATKMYEKYNIKTIGHISVGIPTPTNPPYELLSKVAAESFIIAIVAYIISVSMALIFAQRNKYEIDTNQELLAQGTGNIVGSFFSCAPFSASLSRSVIQETVGGKTQLASLVSCSILLFVLLWLGPLFETLPRCVLSSLIVVALKSILFQVKDLPQIWRLSVLDGLVYIITYLSVVLVEIDVGLLVGICASIVSIFIQGMKPYMCLLARVPGTNIYVDKMKYRHTIDPVGGKIFHYSGGINFANRGYFRSGMYRLLSIYPKQLLSNPVEMKVINKVSSLDSMKKLRYVVLDLSGIHYIDPSGASVMKSVVEEFLELNIPFYAAGTVEPIYESLRVNGLTDSNLFTFFPTIHDAVVYAQCGTQNGLISNAPNGTAQ